MTSLHFHSRYSEKQFQMSDESIASDVEVRLVRTN